MTKPHQLPAKKSMKRLLSSSLARLTPHTGGDHFNNIEIRVFGESVIWRVNADKENNSRGGGLLKWVERCLSRVFALS